MTSADKTRPDALAAPYSFPKQRLKRVMDDPSKTPLCLISCGSFSPITYLHLRMFEMAADYIKFHTDFELVGAYLSPVTDAYKKAGLASAEHRIRMCEMAADQTSDWLMVDLWEAIQPEYQRTAVVLDRFDHQINKILDGVLAVRSTTGSERKPVRIALLAGADLIQTMSIPGVWSLEDIEHILDQYGAFIVERTGTDSEAALATLAKWRRNIWLIEQLVPNDVSSTKIRALVRMGMSIRYLLPDQVVQYIQENGLYKEDPKAK